jgi:integrase
MFEDLKAKKLGLRINAYTAKELADYLKKETTPGTDTSIDFIEFSRKYIESQKSAGTHRSTINALIDFCNGREKIAITEITSKFLTQFEAFLRTERTLKRKNQFGNIVVTKKKSVSDVTVIDYMTNVRTLFNAAVDEYNDEDRDEIRITHYPFRKYKLQRRPESGKRNLKPVDIQKIKNIEESILKLRRTIFARDVFMLSFYLVGMNLADLYLIDEYKNERLSYERKKTKDRRQDRAFISIKVEPEVKDLIEKYRDKTGERIFDFYQRYTDTNNFTSNVDKGLKKVADSCNIDVDLSTYYARHSWATIARNKCGISKDDVDLALNHVDQGLKMADVYIEKDWSLIDLANRKVIDYVNTKHRVAKKHKRNKILSSEHPSGSS